MFEIDSVLVEMSYITPVMTDNNFSLVEGKFFNDECTVEVDLENSVFNVFWREKNTGANYMVTSDNLNLYWLFGFLSAKKLIDRSFKL